MSVTYFVTNYSLGWTVEIVAPNQVSCASPILLPGENLWPIWLRGCLYLLAMLYLFLGIAVACDVFVCSIERIISKTVIVTKVDKKTGIVTKTEEYFWNETVANLTLMALGSSAPEILLATIEAVTTLNHIGHSAQTESLGLFTICGSAAFNLFVITGVCLMSVPSPEVKKIKGRTIFIMNSLWSIWAYIWLLLVSVFISPREIEPWEAFVTILFFPIMVVSVYCQNKKWWRHKWLSSARISDSSNGDIQITVEDNDVELNNIKEDRNKSVDICASIAISNMMDSHDESDKKHDVKKMTTKSRFKHAKFTAVMGVDADTKKKKKHDDIKAVSQISIHSETDKNLLGKIGFKSPTYTVLESEGKVTVTVLFYRIYPLPDILKNPNMTFDEKLHNFVLPVKGVSEVFYETCDGSAKMIDDYEYTSGVLVFEEHECCKSITLQIVDDPNYEEDKDFYVILKRPKGTTTGISDQSITKITIVDDDDPGEYSFDKERYYPTEDGIIHVTILRKNGCDGTAKMQVLSSNKTATGGTSLKRGIDYITVEESVVFSHEEMEQKFEIQTDVKSAKKSIFTISIENLSDGCRFGEIRTAICVVGVSSDESGDDSEEEDATWPDQFRNAMTLDKNFDENGDEIQGGFMVYFLHFCSFFWRFICAFIPPRKYLGAYPSFFGSLVVLGTMTALIEQLGTLLGCVLGIRTEVAGITIVAIGTSLQDTFSSRAAAVQDKTADNSIGHITGSNAVNVFLGLGIPWVISSMYAYTNSVHYCVSPKNLFQSIIVFLILASVSISMLIFRRLVFKGELGGPFRIKVSFGFMFFSLWLIYVIILSLLSYGFIKWDFSVGSGKCH